MAQIGENFSKLVGHDEINDVCPFCPPSESEAYTTYPGEKNDSTKLGLIMENPNVLTDKQSGVRPQTAKVDANGYTQEQIKPDPRKKDDSKLYTFQAHHLISGNQALKDSEMEWWILASDFNEKDTGYSVNCTGNGFWAPSVPKIYQGKWSAEQKVLSDTERQLEAEKVMKDAMAQIHIGHHSIADDNEPTENHHHTYDAYIKNGLAQMSDRIWDWSGVFFLCKEQAKKKQKYQTSYSVHDVLDRFSTHLQGKITGSHSKWNIFLSKYALAYHRNDFHEESAGKVKAKKKSRKKM